MLMDRYFGRKRNRRITRGERIQYLLCPGDFVRFVCETEPQPTLKDGTHMEPVFFAVLCLSGRWCCRNQKKVFSFAVL